MEAIAVAAEGLRAPLRLLEDELRDGEPLPEEFVEELAHSVRSGGADVISVRDRDPERAAGAALVYYRPNLASGGRFACIEELHVAPESQGRGAGRALLAEVERRCSERGISYIEAQIIAESEKFFLAEGYELEPDVRVLSRSIAFS